MKVPVSPHPLQHLTLSHLKILANLMTVGRPLIFISSMTSEVGRVIVYLWATQVSSSVNCQLISIACLPTGLVDSHWCVELLRYSRLCGFIRYLYLQVPSSSGWLYHVVTETSVVFKFLNFNIIEWICFPFCFGCIAWTLCCSLMLQSYPTILLKVLTSCFPHLSPTLFSHVDSCPWPFID